VAEIEQDRQAKLDDRVGLVMNGKDEIEISERNELFLFQVWCE
jgi:hypothetical protein